MQKITSPLRHFSIDEAQIGCLILVEIPLSLTYPSTCTAAIAVAADPGCMSPFGKILHFCTLPGSIGQREIGEFQPSPEADLPPFPSQMLAASAGKALN
ncbi:hypothetical protein [Falsigemmobacter intermedius]|uniref:hypothetical protein n=1 Tax=Falsigemmobacter intermedius TaxID=1553448 RepID=UPI003EFC5D44